MEWEEEYLWPND